MALRATCVVKPGHGPHPEECSSRISGHVDPPNLHRANPSMGTMPRRPHLQAPPALPLNAPRTPLQQRARPERGSPTRKCMITSCFLRELAQRRRSARRRGNKRSETRGRGENRQVWIRGREGFDSGQCTTRHDHG